MEGKKLGVRVQTTVKIVKEIYRNGGQRFVARRKDIGIEIFF